MPNYLDIFAGAGGLSEGFLRVGFTPVAHIEMDKAACYTLKTRLVYKWLSTHHQAADYYRYLNGELSRQELYNMAPDGLLDSVLNYEISKENLREIFEKIDRLLNGQELDLIVGGPPCQAYSLVGRARDENKMVGDKRNYLYILYAEFLRKYHPKYFVFENVSGLLSAKDGDGTLYFTKMQQLFKQCGYSVEYRTLNAKDYGVLQNRERIILIGKYGSHEGFYPNIPKSVQTHLVAEIFVDLPKVKAGGGTYKPVPTLHYDGKYLFEAKIKDADLGAVSLHCGRPHTKQDLKIYRKAVQLWNKEKNV